MTPRSSLNLWGFLLFGGMLCFFLVAANTGANILSFFWLFMTLVSAWQTGLAIRRVRLDEKPKTEDER